MCFDKPGMKICGFSSLTPKKKINKNKSCSLNSMCSNYDVQIDFLKPTSFQTISAQEDLFLDVAISLTWLRCEELEQKHTWTLDVQSPSSSDQSLTCDLCIFLNIDWIWIHSFVSLPLNVPSVESSIAARFVLFMQTTKNWGVDVSPCVCLKTRWTQSQRCSIITVSSHVLGCLTEVRSMHITQQYVSQTHIYIVCRTF